MSFEWFFRSHSFVCFLLFFLLHGCWCISGGLLWTIGSYRPGAATNPFVWYPVVRCYLPGIVNISISINSTCWYVYDYIWLCIIFTLYPFDCPSTAFLKLVMLKKCFTHQSQLSIEDEVSRRVCGEWWHTDGPLTRKRPVVRLGLTFVFRPHAKAHFLRLSFLIFVPEKTFSPAVQVVLIVHNA